MLPPVSRMADVRDWSASCGDDIAVRWSSSGMSSPISLSADLHKANATIATADPTRKPGPDWHFPRAEISQNLRAELRADLIGRVMGKTRKLSGSSPIAPPARAVSASAVEACAPIAMATSLRSDPTGSRDSATMVYPSSNEEQRQRSNTNLVSSNAKLCELAELKSPPASSNIVGDESVITILSAFDQSIRAIARGMEKLDENLSKVKMKQDLFLSEARSYHEVLERVERRLSDASSKSGATSENKMPDGVADLLTDHSLLSDRAMEHMAKLMCSGNHNVRHDAVARKGRYAAPYKTAGHHDNYKLLSSNERLSENEHRENRLEDADAPTGSREASKIPSSTCSGNGASEGNWVDESEASSSAHLREPKMSVNSAPELDFSALLERRKARCSSSI